MKRLLIAVMAVGLGAEVARADWGGPKAPPATPQGSMPQLGGPNTVIGMGDPSNGVAPDKYGLHPRIKRIFGMGGAGKPYPQMGYGQMGPAYNPGGFPAGAYGPAQGTLVFPNHPFVRSPRDYFMVEPNR